MKFFSSTVILLFYLCSCTFAQNSVTINQRGNGNKAIINQGDNHKSTQAAKDTTCNKYVPVNKDHNNIIYQKEDASGTTVLKTSGKHKNNFYIGQHGTNAKSKISMAGQPDSIAAKQKGSKNGISMFIANPDSLSGQSGNNIDLNQRGNDNHIFIGPCQVDSLTTTGRKSSIKVQQKGRGNKANISVSGDGNSIHIQQH